MAAPLRSGPPEVDRALPGPRPSWREVAMPREHGGWGLTAEPVVLGLIVRPSGAGVLLGLAAIVAFVARTPLRVVLVDRHRDRRRDRTVLAGRILAAELGTILVLGTGALVSASAPFLWPVVAAVPLAGVELWFDQRSRSRRLVPELAGTVAIGAVAPAIALAGGAPARVAAGLWLVVAARAVASVPFVRVQLQRARHPEATALPAVAVQGIAVIAVVAGWAAGAVPVAAVVAVAALAVAQVALVRRPPPRAALVGAQQVVLGLAVVLTAGLGAIAP